MMTKYILFTGLTVFAALISGPCVNAQTFTQIHNNELASDGPDKGLEAYALIESVFGKGSIESPDLYGSNHSETQHIYEDEDDIVGPHFVFLSHLNEDRDRGTDLTDRQRNEIKAYDKSKDSLKGYEGETLQYRWKFKIEDGFEFSKNFTHLFQIKAKNMSRLADTKDSDKFPVLTITAVDKRDGTNQFQLRHTPSLDKDGVRLSSDKLVREDMALFTGQWIEFFVQITYSQHGKLIFQAKNIETGALLVDYQNNDLDMWRGEGDVDFARPKWGIYRSLNDKDSLRNDEERARFADFSVRKGRLE